MQDGFLVLIASWGCQCFFLGGEVIAKDSEAVGRSTDSGLS